jgi:hypothetical protein
MGTSGLMSEEGKRIKAAKVKTLRSSPTLRESLLLAQSPVVPASYCNHAPESKTDIIPQSIREFRALNPVRSR